ncbi:transposase [Streptomyces griseoincarnatus]
MVTPPHRKLKETAPAWYGKMRQRRRKAQFSRRIRVEHSIAHLENWRALAPASAAVRTHEHRSDVVHAVVSLLAHQRTADLGSR